MKKIKRTKGWKRAKLTFDELDRLVNGSDPLVDLIDERMTAAQRSITAELTKQLFAPSPLMVLKSRQAEASTLAPNVAWKPTL